MLCSSSCVLPCVAPYPILMLFFFYVSYDLYVFTFSLFPKLYPYYQSLTFSIYSVFYVFRFHILNCLLFTLLLNSMCVYAFSQKRIKKENTKVLLTFWQLACPVFYIVVVIDGLNESVTQNRKQLYEIEFIELIWFELNWIELRIANWNWK